MNFQLSCSSYEFDEQSDTLFLTFQTPRFRMTHQTREQLPGRAPAQGRKPSSDLPGCYFAPIATELGADEIAGPEGGR